MSSVCLLLCMAACQEVSGGDGDADHTESVVISDGDLELVAVKTFICYDDPSNLSTWLQGFGILASSPFWEVPLERDRDLDSIECIKSAQTCLEVFACGDLHSNQAPCDRFTENNFCEGDHQVGCQLVGYWFVTDCAAYGSECVENENTAWCAGPGAACDDETHVSRCDGNVLEFCSDGGIARSDCSNYNMVCAEGDGWAECRLNRNSPCDGKADGDYCDGDQIIYCRNGYPDMDWSGSCSFLVPGATCGEHPEQPGFITCLYDGSATLTQTCEGDVARICLGTQCREIDCSLFANGTCSYFEDLDFEKVECVATEK